jgi:hypothetical protein
MKMEERFRTTPILCLCVRSVGNALDAVFQDRRAKVDEEAEPEIEKPHVGLARRVGPPVRLGLPRFEIGALESLNTLKPRSGFAPFSKASFPASSSFSFLMTRRTRSLVISAMVGKSHDHKFCQTPHSAGGKNAYPECSESLL